MDKKTEQKYSFTLLQRIALINQLPTSGNVAQLLAVRSIKEKIGLVEKDIEEYGITFTDTTVSFNEKGTKAIFEYEFSELEKLEIKNCLQKLNDEKKLPSTLLDVAISFNVS
jgi:predicted double-glycine peptidase